MLIVLDDVLKAKHLALAQEFFSGADARAMRWVQGTFDDHMTTASPMAEIFSKVSRFFDLSRMTGVEQWAHLGTKPDWHVDKDEVRSRRTGELSTPLCSIVFYPLVENLTGGKFLTTSLSVTPHTNRLIAFAPGIWHGVEAFGGTRMAVALNPWDVKPEGY